MLLAAALAAAASLHATPYQLTFSGTYSIGLMPEGSLFGVDVSALPVPYSYTIFYDTALNTNTNVILAGSTFNGHHVAQSFYGYSASGILGVNVAFGTQTWAASDVVWLNPSMTVGAELWFDTDLDVAAPANCWIRFDTGTADVGLGSAALMGPDGNHLGYLPGRSDLWDYSESGSFVSEDMTIRCVSLSQVPDGGSPVLLAGVALLVLAAIRRRRVRAVGA